MRWPWTKTDRSASEGEKARAKAAGELAEARARWPEVNRVAQSLRDLRERNHFSEQIELIFRDGYR